MALGYVATGTIGAGTTTATPGMPVGWTAGDMLLLFVFWKDSTRSATTPSGWTAGTKFTGGTGTVGTDTGTMAGQMFHRQAVAGDTAPTVTVASANVTQAWISAYSKSPANTWTTPTSTGGGDTTGGTDYATTGATTLDLTVNDYVVHASAINTDAPTVSSGTSAVPGCTLGTTSTVLANAGTTSGGDMRVYARTHPIAAGTASGAPTESITWSTGTPSGVSVFARVAETTSETDPWVLARFSSASTTTGVGFPISTPAFTPAANALITVVAVGDEAGAGQTALTISDTASLTWTLVAGRHFGVPGGSASGQVYCWWAQAPASPSATTITVAGTGATQEAFILATLYDPAEIDTAAPIGATANGSTGAGTTTTLSITPDATGGLMQGAYQDYAGRTSASVPGTARMIRAGNVGSEMGYGVVESVAATASGSAQSVTVTWSTSTSNHVNWIAWELKAAAPAGVPVTARCSAGASATAVAAKVASVTARSTVVPAAHAVARRIAPASGAGTAAVGATAVVRKVAPAAGASSMSVAARATVSSAPPVPVLGRSALAVTARATVARATPVTARSAVNTAARAAGTKTAVAVGRSPIGVSALAAIRRAMPVTARSSVSTSARASVSGGLVGYSVGYTGGYPPENAVAVAGRATIGVSARAAVKKTAVAVARGGAGVSAQVVAAKVGLVVARAAAAISARSTILPPTGPPSLRALGTAASTTGAATQSITLPGTVQAGDYILIGAAQRTTNATWVTPAGYTELHNQATTTNNSLVVYGKVAVAGDAGATVTVDPDGTTGLTTHWLVFDGVHTTTPVNASAQAQDTVNDENADAPSVTTTVNDCLIVTFHSMSRGSTTIVLFTPWPGATEGGETIGHNGASGIALYSAYGVKTTPGATGVLTAVADGNNVTNGVTVALAPAPPPDIRAVTAVCALSAAARATVKTVKPVAARSVVPASARAGVAKKAPVSGRSAIGPVARATTLKVAPVTGRSAASVSARASTSFARAVTARCAVPVSARGAVKKAAPTSGQCSAAVAARAGVAKRSPVLGRSATGTSGRALVAKRSPVTARGATVGSARAFVTISQQGMVSVTGRASVATSARAPTSKRAMVGGHCTVATATRAGTGKKTPAAATCAATVAARTAAVGKTTPVVARSSVAVMARGTVNEDLDSTAFWGWGIPI